MGLLERTDDDDERVDATVELTLEGGKELAGTLELWLEVITDDEELGNDDEDDTTELLEVLIVETIEDELEVIELVVDDCMLELDEDEHETGVNAGAQPPVSAVIEFAPLPINTRFDPQLAALANHIFMLS